MVEMIKTLSGLGTLMIITPESGHGQTKRTNKLFMAYPRLETPVD